MCRCFFSLLFLLFSVWASAQADSAGTNGTSAVKPDQRQLRLGVDVSRFLLNNLLNNRFSYEFALDYNIPKDMYLVAEAGWGGSEIDYADLRYSCNNTFFKIGLDKSMLQRLFPSDWDFVFVGFRYGVGFIRRNEAVYTTTDPVWGTTSGVIAPQSMTGHWAELTGGLRVELLKGFFAGYTVRGKFLINQGPFQQLPPAYIAGYGKGEKSTSFDFSFYFQYALRW